MSFTPQKDNKSLDLGYNKHCKIKLFFSCRKSGPIIGKSQRGEYANALFSPGPGSYELKSKFDKYLKDNDKHKLLQPF